MCFNNTFSKTLRAFLFVWAAYGLQSDLRSMWFKFKHAAQWHMMNIMPHTLSPDRYQVECDFICYLIFLLSGYISHVWNVEENKNLAPPFAYWHWNRLFSWLYMSATQTHLSDFISQLYQFYFYAALVFERHGLYPNTEKQNAHFLKPFPQIYAKWTAPMHYYFSLFVDAVDNWHQI